MSLFEEKNETCEICEFTDLEPMGHLQIGENIDENAALCTYELEVYGCKYCMNTILLKIERYAGLDDSGNHRYDPLGDYKLVIVTSNEGRRIEFFRTVLNNRETQAFYSQYTALLEDEITKLYYKIKKPTKNDVY